MTVADVPQLTPVTLSTLAATPQAVRAMVAGLPDEVLRALPDPDANAGDWSLHTVVVHLVDSHRRQVGRVRKMVQEDNPGLANVDEWESLTASGLLDEPTAALLDVLASERAVDVAWYASLGAEALGRTGVHSVGGEVTVANVLNHAAYHDGQHLGQVARLIEVMAHMGRGNMRLVDL